MTTIKGELTYKCHVKELNLACLTTVDGEREKERERERARERERERERESKREINNI